MKRGMQSTKKQKHDLAMDPLLDPLAQSGFRTTTRRDTATYTSRQDITTAS